MLDAIWATERSKSCVTADRLITLQILYNVFPSGLLILFKFYYIGVMSVEGSLVFLSKLKDMALPPLSLFIEVRIVFLNVICEQFHE